MANMYGVATISRLPKIAGLFCKRALQKRKYSAKETYHFKEPTVCSHPTAVSCAILQRLVLIAGLPNRQQSPLPSLLTYQFRPRLQSLCHRFQGHSKVPSETTKNEVSSRTSQLVRKIESVW